MASCQDCIHKEVCEVCLPEEEYATVDDLKSDCPDFILTADIAEVVRCKDCRHCKFNTSAEFYKCDRRGYFTETVAEDGFCSYGERKE